MGFCTNMGCFLKWWGFPPPNHPWINRVFDYKLIFTIHFEVALLLFLGQHPYILKFPPPAFHPPCRKLAGRLCMICSDMFVGSNRIASMGRTVYLHTFSTKINYSCKYTMDTTGSSVGWSRFQDFCVVFTHPSQKTKSLTTRTLDLFPTGICWLCWFYGGVLKINKVLHPTMRSQLPTTTGRLRIVSSMATRFWGFLRSSSRRNLKTRKWWFA